MSATEIMAVAGYPIVGIVGFVLGTILGRTLVSDAQSLLQSLDSKIAGIAGQSATAQAAVAIQAHAAATEKLASAVAQQATAQAAAQKPGAAR